MKAHPTDPRELWDQVIAPRVMVEESGCWLWTRALNHGYAQLTVRKRTVLVHRLSVIVHRGPIPEGMTVDHLCHTSACPGGADCRHRRCVNPDHLEVVTSAENTRRRPHSPGFVGRRLLAGSVCQSGQHVIESPEDIVTHGASRYCRQCRAARARRSYENVKAKRAAARASRQESAA